MIRIPYFLLQALRGMQRSALIQLAAVGAIAVTLLLVGLAALGSHNIARLTEQWGRGLQLTVFLRADAPDESIASLRRLLEQRPEVMSVQEIGSKQALARLSASLGRDSGLLESVESDFFPRLLELRLRPGVDPSTVPLLALLDASPAVERVDHLGRWAERLGQLAQMVRHGSLLIALIVGLSCLYLVASTIRLGIHARREEISIQRLLGATEGFIRAPLLAEGMLQGLLGTSAALLLLYALYRWTAPALGSMLSATLQDGSLTFFSPLQIAFAIAAGGLVGLTGSRLAVGSARRERH